MLDGPFLEPSLPSPSPGEDPWEPGASFDVGGSIPFRVRGGGIGLHNTVQIEQPQILSRKHLSVSMK